MHSTVYDTVYIFVNAACHLVSLSQRGDEKASTTLHTDVSTFACTAMCRCLLPCVCKQCIVKYYSVYACMCVQTAPTTCLHQLSYYNIHNLCYNDKHSNYITTVSTYYIVLAFLE